MILETYPSKKEELYNEHLGEISGVNFTFRELDIIACIVHNRGEKKIAALLSISYRTVGSHVRNIMSKLGYSSREYIIDAVEKSGKLQHVRQYYFHLVMEASFEKHLRKIGGLANRTGILCATDFNNVTAEEQKSLELFTESLVLANITLTDINLLKAEGSYEKARHNLHIISMKSLNKLPGLYQNIKSVGKDAEKGAGEATKENVKKNVKPHPQNDSRKDIAVCFDQDIDLLTIQDLEHVDFRSKSNYYFSVLELIGKLTNKPLVDGIIQEFKDEHQDLQQSWDGTGITGGEFSGNGGTHFMSKNAAIFAGCVGLVILCVWLLVWNNTPSGNNNNSNNMQLASHNQTEIWNLPKQLEHYTQRAKLTKAIWDKFRANKGSKRAKKTSILTGLYGLGGVGKTSLAKNAIHNPSSAQHYDFKGWFSAETKELLQADYFELGEKHYLFTKNISDKQKILRVKDWLEQRGNILLVYDNTPDMSILREYLPDKGHIIITSRNYKLPDVIEVDVMTEKEATKLLDKLIPKKIKQNKAYDKDLKKLAKELGYLPLALSQAGAYIAENMLTIAGYLSLYNTERDRLLSDKTMPTMDKHAPAYITWDMSIKKLQQLNQEGEEALDLLDFIAYCYPENIPKKLLTQYLYKKADNETSVKLNKVSSFLRKYSLIKITSDTVSIHRLVHTWLKSKHSKFRRVALLKQNIAAMKAIYPWRNKTKDDIKFVKLLLPHVEAIISRMQLSTAKGTEYVSLISMAGDINYTLGNYKKSKQLFTQALVINKKYYNKDSIKIGKILHDLGNSYFKLGDYSKAKKLLERVLVIKEKHYSSRHIGLVYILSDLGRVNLYLGNYSTAKELLERTLIINRENHGLNHIEVATSLDLLARTHLYLNDYSKAKELLEKALKIKKTYYGDKHVEVTHSLQTLGRACIKLNNYGKARKLLEESLAIKENHYGSEHMEVSHALHSLARIYLYWGNYRKAKELLGRALVIKEKHYGADHIETIHTMQYAGWIDLKLGNYAKATKYLNKAFIIKEKHNGSKHIFTANALGNLGFGYLALGNYDKGKELFKKALKIIITLRDEKNILAVKALANLGNAYRISKNYQEGKKHLEQALMLLEEHLGHNQEQVTMARVLGSMGLLYGALGNDQNPSNLSYSNNSKKAKEYLEKALSIFQKHLHPKHPDIENTIAKLKQINNAKKLALSKGRILDNAFVTLGYTIVVLP